MRTQRTFVPGTVQSSYCVIVDKIRARFALATMAVLLFLTLPAFASQQVFNSSGGTATLGTDFVLSGATATNPAGTLSINCPITSVGGSSPLIYSCTGGSFNFQSNDGLTTVTGSFTTAKLYLWAAGGGRGGNVHYTYEFIGDFTGIQDVNGLSAAINGETTAVIGPLTREIGSGSATAGAGATGINSTYAPIYVTDSSNSQLVRADDIFGDNKQVLGSTGVQVNEFNGPLGVTLDPSGRIYVVDSSSCRIVRMDNITGANWTTFGHCGKGKDQFSGANDIALDARGRIYVADSFNSRIVRFDDMLGTNWIALGTVGSATNQFVGPQGVAVDAVGKIYIADTSNKRIVRVDDVSGTNWTTLTQSPVINGYIFLFGSPAHVAIDDVGRIVIGDTTNVIRVDDMTGTNWAELGVGTTVSGLSIASDGTTYVAGTTSSGGSGVILLDDVTTGAGFTGTNLVANSGGVYSVPVPAAIPAVTVAPTNLTFAKENTGTASAAQSITLTNFGGAPLNIASIAVTGDFVSTNTCPAALPGGSSCTISISYAPTKTGSEVGKVTITDNAFTGTQLVTLAGFGTAPVAGIAPATVTFQPQLVNTISGVQYVVLSNSGTGPLTFSGTGITASGDFAQTNNCGAALVQQTSCQISVTFTPSASGARTGNLFVTDNAGTQSVSLTGTGASAAPSITISPESLVFPTEHLHSKSAAQSVVLTNGGGTAVSLSIAISGDFAKAGSCPTSLGAGKSCTLNIAFTPTAAGTRTGTLTYTLSTGVVTVALTGTGTSTLTGWLVSSPSSIVFNNGYIVGDNPSQDLTITNTNGVPVGISHLALTGSTTFTQSNNCAATLGPQASCTVTITFIPTVVGTVSGTLTVTESAGTVHKIAVSGTAGTNGGGN
jgi:sugar lactone lactonase YvrE